MNLPMNLNPELADRAREFVLRKWRERAAERNLPAPEDLSGSCKFSSLFAAKLFGLEMRGNEQHQFCIRPDGSIFDLNAGAADVAALADPWKHDPVFWMNPDHREAMESCEARVAAWLEDFAAEISVPQMVYVLVPTPEGGLAGVGAPGDPENEIIGGKIVSGQTLRKAALEAATGCGWAVAGLEDHPFMTTSGPNSRSIWFRAERAQIISDINHQPDCGPVAVMPAAAGDLHAEAIALWRERTPAKDRLPDLYIPEHQTAGINFLFHDFAEENPDLDFYLPQPASQPWLVQCEICDDLVNFWPHKGNARANGTNMWIGGDELQGIVNGLREKALRELETEAPSGPEF
ncbi:hypothetical protein [Paracoccus sp. ME4]|uniref:hypothetical protein n=1 Tax=Paracoccus sp. ME4 TaxID=3138066 RepID=UPI00398B484B